MEINDNPMRVDTPTQYDDDGLEHPAHLRQMAIEEMLADMTDFICSDTIASSLEVAYAMIKNDSTDGRVDVDVILNGESEEKIAAIVKLSGFELFTLTLRNMLIHHLDEQDIEEYIDNVLIERGEV